MDKLNNALLAVGALRSSVRQCFEQLSEGQTITNTNKTAENNQSTSETDKFANSDAGRNNLVQDFQEIFSKITSQLKEVESLVSSLPIPQTPNLLGNTSYLAQETTQERQSLYPQLVNSYKWIDKVHDHSFLAFNNLNQNNLRRSYVYCSQKRGRIPLSSCPSVDPEHTEKLFSEINHLHTTYKVCRPFGSNIVVMVTIGRILKAAIVCKGVLIEWVTVKGYAEPLEQDDIWTESRYEVFRKVQEHTHSAMLHFFSPTLPDLAVKSYMTWLNSYSKLFLEPCKRCGKFISGGLPPTWRDLRTLEPFHEECRNLKCERNKI